MQANDNLTCCYTVSGELFILLHAAAGAAGWRRTFPVLILLPQVIAAYILVVVLLVHEPCFYNSNTKGAMNKTGAEPFATVFMLVKQQEVLRFVFRNNCLTARQ